MIIQERLELIANDLYESMLDSMQENTEYMDLIEEEREAVDAYLFNNLFPNID